MKKLFEGVGVALVTPFKKNKIDFEALKTLINKDITEGADAIIILATTGEGTTISYKEREEIIKFSLKEINNKAKLIVGTGNNDFKNCLKLTKMAKDLGADGALVVTPYYNKTTQQGIVNYYKELSKLKFPMIAYNVPSRTGLNINLETFKEILDNNPYIYGIKEATTDIVRIQDLIKICRDKVAVYSGEDELNFLFYCLGANGCISVTANVACKYVKHLYNYCKNENLDKARKLNDKLNKLDKALFLETNPIPVKAMLSKLELISNEVRLPLVRISSKNEENITKIAKDFKVGIDMN